VLESCVLALSGGLLIGGDLLGLGGQAVGFGGKLLTLGGDRRKLRSLPLSHDGLALRSENLRSEILRSENLRSEILRSELLRDDVLRLGGGFLLGGRNLSCLLFVLRQSLLVAIRVSFHR
jgi:hypothetical protein